jgi:hypothetical protein
MPAMALPNLFVIGAPKCGTTSLHHYLDQHPKVAMSVVKEPKYFLADGRRPAHRGPGDERACRNYVVDRSAYEALFHFPPGPGSYAGESSPYYLWAADAGSRIRVLVPDARLVAVLREPTMRAFSNWADLREQGREKLAFADALAAEERRHAENWEPFWYYRSLGLYGAQLSRLLDVFPRQQVKVVLSEELAEAPRQVMDQVFEFLGLEPLGERLAEEHRNQTMYAPVDRRSRAVEALWAHGQRARAVVPVPVRRLGRRLVRKRLQSLATSGARGRELRSTFGQLFEEDRRLLDSLGLGLDLGRWDGGGRRQAP